MPALRRGPDGACPWRGCAQSEAGHRQNSHSLGRAPGGAARRNLEFPVVRRSGAARQSHGAGRSARRGILAGNPKRARRFRIGAGRRYPSQFEAVGERVRLAAQLAQSVNYQIQYTPGPVNADGTIRSFALQARAGNYGFRNFFLDDTGILRSTRESRSATSEDPPY